MCVYSDLHLMCKWNCYQHDLRTIPNRVFGILAWKYQFPCGKAIAKAAERKHRLKNDGSTLHAGDIPYLCKPGDKGSSCSFDSSKDDSQLTHEGCRRYKVHGDGPLKLDKSGNPNYVKSLFRWSKYFVIQDPKYLQHWQDNYKDYDQDYPILAQQQVVEWWLKQQVNPQAPAPQQSQQFGSSQALPMQSTSLQPMPTSAYTPPFTAPAYSTPATSFVPTAYPLQQQQQQLQYRPMPQQNQQPAPPPLTAPQTTPIQGNPQFLNQPPPSALEHKKSRELMSRTAGIKKQKSIPDNMRKKMREHVKLAQAQGLAVTFGQGTSSQQSGSQQGYQQPTQHTYQQPTGQPTQQTYQLPPAYQQQNAYGNPQQGHPQQNPYPNPEGYQYGDMSGFQNMPPPSTSGGPTGPSGGAYGPSGGAPDPYGRGSTGGSSGGQFGRGY